jgi:hypothetical protein
MVQTRLAVPLILLLATVSTAGCGKPTPLPGPPKPVATAKDACDAALAYAASQIARVHNTVEFTATPLSTAEAKAQMPKTAAGWQGTGPTADWFAAATPAALPADCEARRAKLQAQAGPLAKWAEIDRVSPPILSANGREALILAREGCTGSRCAQGTATFLRQDADGVWRIVGQAGLWMS